MPVLVVEALLGTRTSYSFSLLNGEIGATGEAAGTPSTTRTNPRVPWPSWSVASSKTWSTTESIRS
ncbi:hypothetical protein ACFQ0T_23645 [Kitasatospora gansuensis]